MEKRKAYLQPNHHYCFRTVGLVKRIIDRFQSLEEKIESLENGLEMIRNESAQILEDNEKLRADIRKQWIGSMGK